MTSTHERAYSRLNAAPPRGSCALMIEAHTSDAWTRLSPSVRRTIAFRDATVLGGFAAPLFLWLAGLAVVLAATGPAAARSDPAMTRGGRHDPFTGAALKFSSSDSCSACRAFTSLHARQSIR